MEKGEMFWMPSTERRFIAEEVNRDGSRAVVAGEHLRGRMIVTRQGDRFYARSVRDNGASGASLFASLTEHGPRYTVRPVSS